MLVAEKRRYADIYYPPTVEKEQPVSVPRSRSAVKTKTKSKFWPRLFHVVLVVLGFALCSYTVARFAMIAQNQNEIMVLERALIKQQNLQEQKKLELTSRGNLEGIEEFARNNLEMSYPEKEQIFFVELPEKSGQEFTDSTPKVPKKGTNLWSMLISLLD